VAAGAFELALFILALASIFNVLTAAGACANKVPFATKRQSATQLGTRCGLGLELKILFQFSPPPYAIGNRKDAQGGFGDF
jgi:hypothetical protein